MKLYQVTTTFDGDGEVPSKDTIYFGSHTKARAWCNEAIRKEFDRCKKMYGLTLMKEMYSESIEIAEVTTCPNISTKEMFLLMLNYEGGYFASQRVVEKWGPQDKWQKSQEGE